MLNRKFKQTAEGELFVYIMRLNYASSVKRVIIIFNETYRVVIFGIIGATGRTVKNKTVHQILE